MSLTLLYGIDGMMSNRQKNLDAEEIVDDFFGYISLHNNNRPLPTLDGLTPIQNLRTYQEYAWIARMDPMLP